MFLIVVNHLKLYIGILLLGIILIVSCYYFYMTFWNKSPQTLSEDSEQFSKIAYFIAADLKQKQVQEETRGGIFYGIKEVVLDGSTASVSLVIRPVLPETHPNYFEEQTEFVYILSLSSPEILTIEAPDAARMIRFKEAFGKTLWQ